MSSSNRNGFIMESRDANGNIVIGMLGGDENGEAKYKVLRTFPVGESITDILPDAEHLMAKIRENAITQEDKNIVAACKEQVVDYVSHIIPDSSGMKYGWGERNPPKIVVYTETQAILLMDEIRSSLRGCTDHRLRGVSMPEVNILTLAFARVSFPILYHPEFGGRIFECNLRFENNHGFINHSFGDPRADIIVEMLQRNYFNPWKESGYKGDMFARAVSNPELTVHSSAVEATIVASQLVTESTSLMTPRLSNHPAGFVNSLSKQNKSSQQSAENNAVVDDKRSCPRCVIM